MLLKKNTIKIFLAITCEDGITRYFSSGYPEVKARVYDTRNWRKGDIVDDYIQKLERYLFYNVTKKKECPGNMSIQIINLLEKEIFTLLLKKMMIWFNTLKIFQK